MPPTSPAPSRIVPFTLLGLCAAASASILAFAPRPRGPERPCEPTASVRLNASATSLPIALAHYRGAVYALVATTSARGVRVDMLRVRDGSVSVLGAREAPSLAAVSGFTRTPDGPTFAIARGPEITVTEIAAHPVRDTVFPRGEQPLGRADVTPSIALAREPDGGLTALAAWPSAFAPRRLHARDVRESPSYTPPRLDTFGAEDILLLGDRAAVVQEHREGTFLDGPRERTAIEIVSVPVSPFHIERPRTLKLSEDVPGRSPRAAAVDPSDPSRGAFVAYTTDVDLQLLRVVTDTTPAGWRVASRSRVAEAVPSGAGASDVGSAAGACDVIAAWRTPAGLVVRAMDSATGRAGPIARVTEAYGAHGAYVRVERLGALTLVATHGARGVSVYQAQQGTSCEVTLRPLLLPRTRPFGPGARLAGFAADATRAVLAVTHAPSDAARTELTFATVSGPLGAITLAPAPETIPSPVTELGVFTAPVAIVAGRGPRGVRLQRVGDAGDDGEAGEDLLMRGSRAQEFTLAASGALHRVWVADTAGPEPSDFGPAGSVVFYSAIDTLEDGPRTEIRLGTVPNAAFAHMTLDPIVLTGRPDHPAAWASTWSASSGPDCLPGAWAALYQPDDRPIARAHPVDGDPFPHAMSLAPQGMARCGDRVDSIVWSGARFAATLSGINFGNRIAFGDIDAGPPTLVALTSPDGTPVRAATASSLGLGVAAVWLSGPARAERLRYRLFSFDGAPRTAAETLSLHVGAGLAADHLALSVEGAELAAAVASAQGPTLVRAQCRLP